MMSAFIPNWSDNYVLEGISSIMKVRQLFKNYKDSEGAFPLLVIHVIAITIKAM